MPALFAGRIFERQILWQLLAGLAAFCAIASVVYIVNDTLDASLDRLHITKRLRPIASGAVRPWQGMALAAALTALGGWLVFLAGADTATWATIALYAGLNVAYSLGVKNIPLLDLVILTAGFFLRVLFGSMLSGIHLSNWMYLVVISFSLFMGMGKRRNELRRNGANGRLSLRYYTQAFLDKNMYMVLCLSVVFYSLWCIDGAHVIAVSGGGGGGGYP